MLALRLPDDIEKRLDNLAKRTGRSKSFYAREAIVEHLEDLEDIYLAEKELLKIRHGAQTHGLDDIMKEYGLEG
jgi:RHH-type rel operon transcriptional repressor/antitoxin RelB